MVYWKDGEVKYVGHDVHTITPCQLYDANWELFDWNLPRRDLYGGADEHQPSGKWIAGAYKTEEERNHQIVETGDYPAFYNTETEKTTIFEDYNGYYAATVTDDGLGVIQSRYGTEGYVVDVEAKCAVGSVSQWVYDTYGIVIPDDCGIMLLAGPYAYLGSGPAWLRVGRGHSLCMVYRSSPRGVVRTEERTELPPVSFPVPGGSRSPARFSGSSARIRWGMQTCGLYGQIKTDTDMKSIFILC